MGPPAGTERFRRGHCIIGRPALTRCRIPGYIVGGCTPCARANGGSPEMFRIGSVPIDPPLILAPMAGITDQNFRRILKRIGGVGLVSDRKSTRLNSSHLVISYAVFCLKKKKKINIY